MHDKDADTPSQDGKQPEVRYHQIILEPGENQEARIAAMYASGEAKEGDKFFVIEFVELIGSGYPKHVLERWGRA
jgi:hypothetical protein